MLELSKEQCIELEKRVYEKLCSNIDESGPAQLYATITKAAIMATITTIREYEKMKADSAASQK